MDKILLCPNCSELLEFHGRHVRCECGMRLILPRQSVPAGGAVVRFACQVCGKKLRAKVGNAGEMGPCSGCGSFGTVPLPEPAGGGHSPPAVPSAGGPVPEVPTAPPHAAEPASPAPLLTDWPRPQRATASPPRRPPPWRMARAILAAVAVAACASLAVVPWAGVVFGGGSGATRGPTTPAPDLPLPHVRSGDVQVSVVAALLGPPPMAAPQGSGDCKPLLMVCGSTGCGS